MEERPTMATVAFIDERTQIARDGIDGAIKAMKEILAEKIIQNGVRGNSQGILGKLEDFSDHFLKLDKAVHHAYGPKPEPTLEDADEHLAENSESQGPQPPTD